MARPHRALVRLASGRGLPVVEDHDEVARSAIEHRMGGMLWTRVQRGEVDGPSEWRHRLAGADLVTRAHHERLWATLVRVAAELRERGLDVASFKGVTAEHRWYGRLGERPCSDVDLLLHPDQLRRIDEVVSVVQPDHPLRGRVAPLVTTGRLQSVELTTSDGVSIDLHADVFKLWLPSRREIAWSRTTDVPWREGASVRALDAEASLVQFLVHLTKDRFRSLLGYADVARLLRLQDLDHDFIRWWVRTEGIEIHYDLALNVVVDTLGLPGDVAPFRGPRALTWRVVWRSSIRLRGTEGQVRFRQRQIWVTLLARGHPVAKARFLARKLFPPAELVAYRGHGRGPYAWRLTVGRAAAAASRWRARRQLHSATREDVVEPPVNCATPTLHPSTMAAALREASARGPLTLPTGGHSMGRLIADDARVTIRPSARPRRGEVWAFCLPGGRVVVHRCRGRRPGGWLFQGDRRAIPDPVVPGHHLVGRVVAVEKDGQRKRLGTTDRWGGSALALAFRVRHARDPRRRTA